MPTSKPVTLQDIAVRIGVNVSTVSLALKNSSRISVERRTEIQLLAKELNYRVNAHAVTLAHFRKQSAKISSALAWINDWPDPDRMRAFKEFNAYWLGAYNAAEKRGYRLEEFRSNDSSTAKRLSRVLRSRGIRGILVLPSYRGAIRDWKPLLSPTFTLVRFGMQPPDSLFQYSVTSDQALNSRLAFEKMEQFGYRRIGFVTRLNDTNQNSSRAGYLIAQINSKNVAPIPPLTLSWDGNATNLVELDQWMQSQRPDGIFTNIGSLKSLLLQLGTRVPQEVGLAGTTVLDVDASAGIDQQPYFIGKAAADWLISLVQHRDLGSPQPSAQLLIKGKWIDGADLPPRL